MLIIQKQLNADIEYCELILPLVNLDEFFHCQVCPCYEGNKIAEERRKGAFVDLECFCVYCSHIHFEC